MTWFLKWASFLAEDYCILGCEIVNFHGMMYIHMQQLSTVFCYHSYIPSAAQQFTYSILDGMWLLDVYH
jgi:hypothetical protein